MASQYSNSRLKQGLHWTIGFMLNFEGSPDPKGTLGNLTATSSSSNVHPNPHKQKTHLATQSLVLITSSPFFFLKYHYCAAYCTCCVMVCQRCGYFITTFRLFSLAIRIQAGHKASIAIQFKWFVLSLWCKLINWNHFPLWLPQHKSLKMPFKRHPH